MKWVTRAHVHVDRVACPWLISRFVDSEAQFVFVAAPKVRAYAQEFGAIPFDIPGAELGHSESLCSFDAIIRKYDLKNKALLRMAAIVNAADTDDMSKDPIAAGLEAIATGFSIRYPDDMENLSNQFEVYDALYAWCRLETAREE
ncbi:MAG: chromate resistance protein ChrB domain-containing protein [Candidatus Brocadiia bacterium]